MARRVSRYLLFALLGPSVAAIVALAVLAMRLGEGPVSLSFMLPTVEWFLNRTIAPYHATVGAARIEWRGWADTVRVEADQVMASLPGHPQPRIDVRHLAVGLLAPPLRRGMIAAESVHLDGVSVSVGRQADGRFDFARPPRDDAVDAAAGGDLLQALIGPMDPNDPISLLASVTLEDITVAVTEEAGGAPWLLRIPRARAEKTGEMLSLQMDAEIDIDGATPRLALSGTRPTRGEFDLSATFATFRPADLAALAPPLAPLSAVALPLDGTVTLGLNTEGDILRLSADLAGGAGTLSLPQDLAEAIGEPRLAQQWPVEALILKASTSSAAGDVAIEDLSLRFAQGAQVLLPAPVDHAMPIRSLKLQGTYGGDRATVTSLALDLAGPTITVTAEAEGIGGDLQASGKAVLRNLPVNALKTYWPPALAPGGFTWCTTNLSDGMLTSADIDLRLAGGDSGIEVTALAGTLRADGVTVRYLPPLPPVRGARATASVGLDRLSIDILDGESDGIRILGGQVILQDFDQPVETIDIDIELAGPASRALDLIGREPLGFTKGMTIDTSRVGGDVRARLQLAFPLLADLDFDAARVGVLVEIRRLDVPDGPGGLSITDGNLLLRIDNEALNVDGALGVAGIRGRLQAIENFAPTRPDRQRIELTFTGLRNVNLARLAGSVPVTRYFTDGSIAGSIAVVTPWTGQRRVSANLNLSQATLAVAEVGWRKPAGVPGWGSVQVVMDGERISAIPTIDVIGGGLLLDARASLNWRGDLDSLTIRRFSFGRTDITGALSAFADGWDVRLSGTTLDLATVRQSRNDTDSAESGDSAGVIRRLTISANVDRVWTTDSTHIDQVLLTAVRDDGDWRLAQASAVLPSGALLVGSVTPAGTDSRDLRVETNDVGGAFAALGLSENFRAGRLRVKGTFDDLEPGRPLEGEIKIEDFAVIRAPVLAQILGALSLPGFLDTLRGAGIGFTRAEVPFVWQGGRLRITDAYCFGSSIGMTGRGTIGIDDNTISIRGTVIPFYALNSALGRLPLIGPLFTGGEKRGGLFAASYTLSGDLDNPSVGVNPFATFLPSFLREIFVLLENMLISGRTSVPPLAFP